MIRGLFIAGTDTGVGKTEVACALLSVLAERVASPYALKACETGCEPDAPLDALALRAACGASGAERSLDSVCPQRFRMPAAPLIAAEAEGRSVDKELLLSSARAAFTAGAPLVVEAAGGLLVPLWREGARIFTNLDLAFELGLPVLLVARAGLGTINHSALSAFALAQRGIKLTAIALNRTQPGESSDPTFESNARIIAELCSVRVLGPGPFEPLQTLRIGRLRPLVEPLIDEMVRH